MLLLESLSLLSHFELIFLEVSSVFNLLNSVFFGSAQNMRPKKPHDTKLLV